MIGHIQDVAKIRQWRKAAAEHVCVENNAESTEKFEAHNS